MDRTDQSARALGITAVNHVAYLFTPAIANGVDRAFINTHMHTTGGSVAEWIACWTQAQKGLGSNRSRDVVTGNVVGNVA